MVFVVRDVESKWTTIKACIEEMAVNSSGQMFNGACNGAIQKTYRWTLIVKMGLCSSFSMEYIECGD